MQKANDNNQEAVTDSIKTDNDCANHSEQIEQPGAETNNITEQSSHDDIKKEVQKDVLGRLRKIEGQVRGIQKMISDERTCGDIITQLTAVKSAVNRVGFTILACQLADQIEKDIHEGKNVKESLDRFMTTFKKFS